MTVKDPIEIRREANLSILNHDYSQGPLFMIAGPGTGKTYNLLETIKFQLKRGLAHTDFFEATLTNVAAKDFIRDAKKAISSEFESSSTLHYRAKGILHKYASLLNLNPSFTVIDDIYKKATLCDIAYILHESPRNIERKLKGYQETSAQLKKEGDNFSNIYNKVQFFYAAIDWFDVMKLACQLLEEHQNAREAECYKFKFLLIDEYQDLNKADQWFVKLLLNGRTNFIAVGDNDQSIYSVRYVEPKGITDYKSQYPTAKQESLTVTSRMPTNVINASYSLISINKTHDPAREKLVPLRENDERAKRGFVVSVNLKSDKAEAEFIYKALTQLRENKITPSQILVLCNSKAVGRELIEKLRKFNKNIPIQNDIEEEKAVDENEVLLKHLRKFVTDRGDNISLRIILGKLLEPYPNDVSYLVSRALEGGVRLWETITNQNITKQIEKSKPIVDSFLCVVQKADQYPTFDERISYIISTTPQLRSLLEYIKITEEEADHPEGKEAETPKEEKIRFMTLQSSKGLDADFVFIPFMEESIGLAADDIEEKRRLLYVAITRAKVGIIFSWAWSRRSSKRYKSTGKGGKTTERSPLPYIAECGIKPSLRHYNAIPSSSEVAIKILTEHAIQVNTFDTKHKK